MGFPITVRVTRHTSPLITKSVVALGNQGVLCWVYMFVNPMRESIEFGVFVGLWSKWWCRVDRLLFVSLQVRLVVYLTHPPSQLPGLS